MKSKQDFFKALKLFLANYEFNKSFFKLSSEMATNKTLHEYSDFYEWIQEKDKFSKTQRKKHGDKRKG